MSRNCSRSFFSLFAALIAVGLIGTASAQDKKTERLWKAKCSSCHGMDGKADTEKGKKLKVASMATPEFQKMTDDAIEKAILEGVKETRDGVEKEMDPFKDELKPDQVTALVGYIRSLSPKK